MMMIAQHNGTQQARTSSKTIEQWSGYLQDLNDRIAHRFLRPEVRQRVYRYLAALLGMPRWGARTAGGWPRPSAGPRGAPHLLNDAHWDADLLRDDLAEYVVENLGDLESGVFIIDWSPPPLTRGDEKRDDVGY